MKYSSVQHQHLHHHWWIADSDKELKIAKLSKCNVDEHIMSYDLDGEECSDDEDKEQKDGPGCCVVKSLIV